MTEAVDEGSSSSHAAPSDGVARELLARAGGARDRAYAPYSRFPVGAALLDEHGNVHIGANVENASFGLTVCAERAAVFRAIADGARRFRAIAIVGAHHDRPCHPCGACRQVLHEFAPDLIVYTPGPRGAPLRFELRELLPEAFGPDALDAPGVGGRIDSSSQLDSR